MARQRFGQGQYRYFRHPLPDLVAELRAAFWPHLLPIARDWAARRGDPAPWPDEFQERLDLCHANGQVRPTPWPPGSDRAQAAARRHMSLAAAMAGVHGIDATLRRTVADHHGTELADRFARAHPPAHHPLVRAHPDTGAPGLYICPMYLDHIAELHPDESAMVLSHLEAVATDPHRAVRWRWTEGDLVIWDEACTLHRALVDHHPSIRRMRRCTIDGDWPRSVSRA